MTIAELAPVTVDMFEWEALLSRRLRGPAAWSVSVSYRLRPVPADGISNRRWVRFQLIPDPGESFDGVGGKVAPAIVQHFIREAVA